MSSIYEQIGGQQTIEKIVNQFYIKVLSDERLKQFFINIDMEKQKAKQIAFLTMLMGGPTNYTGKDMSQGHAHLFAQGLTEDHMKVLLENLQATLIEMNLPAQVAQQFVDKFAAMRKMVFSHSN